MKQEAMKLSANNKEKDVVEEELAELHEEIAKLTLSDFLFKE